MNTITSIDWFSANGVLSISFSFAVLALGSLVFLINLFQCIGRPTSEKNWVTGIISSITMVALLILTLTLELFLCDQKSVITFLGILALITWSLNTLTLSVTWFRHFWKSKPTVV